MTEASTNSDIIAPGDSDFPTAPKVELSKAVLLWGGVSESPEELAQQRIFMGDALRDLSAEDKRERVIVADPTPELSQT